MQLYFVPTPEFLWVLYKDLKTLNGPHQRSIFIDESSCLYVPYKLLSFVFLIKITWDQA